MAPKELQGPPAQLASSEAAKATVTVTQPTANAAALPQNPLDGFSLTAAGPIGLMNATATARSTQSRSSPNNAIDGNPATKWRTNRLTLNPTLTVELNNPFPAKLLTLTMNTDAFPTGTSFDVQLSADNVTYTTVLANQTKTTAGSVTLTIPATAGFAKFVRIKCNNRPRFSRVSFGILEMSATADIAPPAPPPGTGGGGTGVAGPFAFATHFPSVPQYRPGVGRLRYEMVGAPGAPETVALNNLEAEATADPNAFQFPAHAKVTLASTGQVLGDYTVLMTTVPGEPGVILGTDAATGDIVELIWPLTATGIPGDAIVRVQLGNAPFGLDGQGVNVSFAFSKFDGNATVASWTGSSTNVAVPPAR
jgi:hypothetical protein